MLTLVLWIAAVLCIVIGLIGIVMPVLPGPALVYLGLIFAAWAHQFERIGLLFLLLAGAVTALMLLVDFVAGAAGTKKYGGSAWGVGGAAVGAIAGLLVFPPFGLILGPLAGAVAGELIAGKTAEEATRAGWGSFLGFLAGTLVKYVACCGMVAAAAVAHFW
jgi:uncharacterized protein YqgC (DUF456 family)